MKRRDAGVLPDFNPDGCLPAGDYELTLDELRRSRLVVAPAREYPEWDGAWRSKLVDNLEILVKQLWQVGVTDIFIDGSFVENKDHPNDIDGYFRCDPHEFSLVQLRQELNRIDPHGIWTWEHDSRRTYRRYSKPQLPMWHQYRVELYPHRGQPSGIKDEYGNNLTIPAAFRRSRLTGQPRGIVKIKQGGR